MKYKGIELVEITVPQIFDQPKKMVVWNMHEGREENVREVIVVAILPELTCHANVVCQESWGTTWATHCAEIPEEPKKRATNRQVSRWLAQGNGECTHGKEIDGKGPFCKSSLYYDAANSNEKCSDEVRIRKWDDTEWHEPTLEYMGLEA